MFSLELAKGKRVNIYTDSKYAHGAIWKEQGLLSANGIPVKYGTEILNIFEAVQKLNEAAIIHCKANQKKKFRYNLRKPESR